MVYTTVIYHYLFRNTRFLTEKSDSPHRHNPSDELNQNRPIMIRNLSGFGKIVYLHVPRRQFYRRECQRYLSIKLWCPDTINRHFPSR